MGKKVQIFLEIFNEELQYIITDDIICEVDELMKLGLDKLDEKVKCSLCGTMQKRYTFYVVDDVKICLYCWCKK